MPQLELYYKKTCPYCMKVLRFMKKNELEIPLKDIEKEQEYRDELEKVGGKVQVPCLFIDGKPMYESSDIINYLKENVAAK